jgi:hypothetical protein
MAVNSPRSVRLTSLDVFRGLTIAGMILVNTPGDAKTTYPQLLHADWNGCTPTDWVFPWCVSGRGYAPPSDTPRGLFPNSLMSPGIKNREGVTGRPARPSLAEVPLADLSF